MSVCVGTCRGVAGHVSILVARRLLLSWVGCFLHSLPCATAILLCTIVCAAAGGGPILVFHMKLFCSSTLGSQICQLVRVSLSSGQIL